MEIFVIIFAAMLVNNYVLTQFLGMCSFLGVSKRVGTATGMSVAVTFVITVSAAINFLVYHFLLDPNGLEYLRVPAFILIIAALVQLVEMFVKKTSPTLFNALGIYLPLITTNCAVLGVSLLIIGKEYNFIESVIYALAASVGYTIAIVLLASIRERLEYNNIPKAVLGFPLALFSAGLMSIAFLGFSGLIK